MQPTEPPSGGLTGSLSIVAALLSCGSLLLPFILKRRADLKDRADAEAKAQQDKAETEAKEAKARRRRHRAARARQEREERDRRLTSVERQLTEQTLANVRQDGDIRGFGALLTDLSAAFRELRSAILHRNSSPGGE